MNLRTFISFPFLSTSLLRLNIKDNEISEIPAEIGGLVNLTYLNLANNPIVRLPVEIHKLKGLEALVLDGLQATLQYPPASAAASTDDVMAFLCKEAGVEFVPPGDVALAAVVTPAASAATAPHVLARESAFLALRQSEQERIDQLMKVGALFVYCVYRSISNSLPARFQLRDQEHQEALAKQEMLRKSRLEQQEQRTALLTQRQQDRQDMATVVNLAISTAQENALKYVGSEEKANSLRHHTLLIKNLRHLKAPGRPPPASCKNPRYYPQRAGGGDRKGQAAGGQLRGSAQ